MFFLWVSRPGLKLGMLHACWVFFLFCVCVCAFSNIPVWSTRLGKVCSVIIVPFLSEGKVSILSSSVIFTIFLWWFLSAPGFRWSVAAIWQQLLLHSEGRWLLVNTFSVWVKSALHFWAVVVEFADDGSLSTEGTDTISIFYIYCLTRLCLCQSRLSTAVLGLKFPCVKWFQSGPCSALHWDYYWECPLSESLRQIKTICLTAFEIFSHYCVFIISFHHLSGCTEWVHELILTSCSRWVGLSKNNSTP